MRAPRLFAASCAAALTIAAAAHGADTVTVDLSKLVMDVRGRQVGINLNYLTDDDKLRPSESRSLAGALRDMRAGTLRYPGGEKADNHLWSVPPFTAPLATLARTGPDDWPSGSRQFTAADNKTFTIDTMDFDEFIATARAAGAEPTLVVCYDAMYKAASGTGAVPTRAQLIETAAAWVRYANVTKKLGVRHWEIGNESYSQSYNGGAPSAEAYADDVKAFSQAMKAVDPTIRIGANGRGTAWFQTVIARAGESIDFLAVHDYPVWAWGAQGFEKFRTGPPSLTPQAKNALAAIETAAPALRSRLTMAITELNVIDYAEMDGWPDVNDLGHALVLFDLIGQHLVLPKVDFIQIWNTRWVRNDTPQPRVFDTLDARNALLPTGRALTAWGGFLRDRIVSTTAPTQLRVYASSSSAGDRVSVFLINKEPAAREATLTVRGWTRAALARRYSLTGSGPEDLRPVWTEEPALNVSASGTLTLSLPAVSLTVLDLGAPPASDASADPEPVTDARSPAPDAAADARSTDASSSTAADAARPDGRRADAPLNSDAPAAMDTSGCGCRHGQQRSSGAVLIWAAALFFLARRRR